MIDVNKLRSHYADAEVASALFNGLPHYSERTKSCEQLQKARDAILCPYRVITSPWITRITLEEMQMHDSSKACAAVNDVFRVELSLYAEPNENV